MMQPYIGLGIGYNLIDIHQSGNIKTVDGKSVICKNPQNTFNYNFVLGFGIAAENTLSFFMELLYSYLKLNYYVEFFVDKTIMNSSVQLNKLYLNVGFKVRV